MKKKALFTGTFDPFTIGHYALVQRALCFTDEIIIAIGVNYEKHTLFTLEERLNDINRIFCGENRITVTSYDALTVDFAKDEGVDFILRGIRNISDFEYEKNMADINLKMSNIETVFLFADTKYQHVSSSLVRELIYYKKDISKLIPILQ
ncbi:MAG: pantetheine-phosphate adenylyltransferase [Tannerella sp.]|jgi:pantetheine-phosphate adenylyltransferase|nr:pantetheine-phosphate adenylyltransferase [Tannerella sp.]